MSKSIPKINATDKLTEHQERKIAFLAVFGFPSNRTIADEFDISPATVSKITQQYAGKDLEASILDEFGDHPGTIDGEEVF